MRIKIYDFATQSFTRLCLMNVFIRINFLFNQIIIEINTHKISIK
jgi:hypothetical protein